jgi:urease accessory protein
MSWHAQLSLDYALERERSVVRYKHEGPIRILQSLYPEGDAVCHNVLVHPPGGFVGGDVMDIHITAARGSHGLITTPGATRYYRTEQGASINAMTARLQEGARLEWLPQEALAYPGCDAINQITLHLAASAELMAWDVTALGLDHAQSPFNTGCFVQHMEIPGVWLERGVIDALDQRLMRSPLGLAGQRCLASLIFASGSPLAHQRVQAALESGRTCLDDSPLRFSAGVTLAAPQVMVLRVLAPMTEPAVHLLRRVWAIWRESLWGLDARPSRLWNL